MYRVGQKFPICFFFLTSKCETNFVNFKLNSSSNVILFTTFWKLFLSNVDRQIVCKLNKLNELTFFFNKASKYKKRFHLILN